ncbi:MAG TPA: CBS domain-containing protein, partial [Bordetella sp.]|nr:CBS domain-containing protein [Bordetella sp.]
MLKVSEILRVKGDTLYTATPDTPVSHAVRVMAEQDIGSMVIMESGMLTGMLTFREIIRHLNDNGGS